MSPLREGAVINSGATRSFIFIIKINDQAMRVFH
jgi:hypothetical protein